MLDRRPEDVRPREVSRMNCRLKVLISFLTPRITLKTLWSSTPLSLATSSMAVVQP